MAGVAPDSGGPPRQSLDQEIATGSRRGVRGNLTALALCQLAPSHALLVLGYRTALTGWLAGRKIPRMDLATLVVSSFVGGLSGALMPGPITAATVAHAVRRGHLAGPLISLGHGLVEGSLVIGLALGLSQLLRTPIVAGVIGVLGGLCLFYMGWGMIRAEAPSELRAGAQATADGPGPVLAGILLSVSSPYWVLWWATAGATMLANGLQYGAIGVAVFYASHFAADLGWLSAIGSAIAAGRGFLTPRFYKGIIAVCGVFLLGLGVYFLSSGVGSLQQL